MTKLQRLYQEQGQSPWLDNLTRGYLRDGTLGRLVADGIRGVTANPTILAKAIEGSDAYDRQFATLVAQGRPVADAYWDLVVDDIAGALGVLRPTIDTKPSPPPASCTSASTSRTCSSRSRPPPRACPPSRR